MNAGKINLEAISSNHFLYFFKTAGALKRSQLELNEKLNFFFLN